MAHCMPNMVNPIWSIIDVCHKRLIRVRRYRRKKKKILLCILAKKFENINFLKTPKEAVLKISCNSVDGGPRRY